MRQGGVGVTICFLSERLVNEKPVILYASTFTKGISSSPIIYDEIKRLIQTKDWNWILTLHPKTEASLIEQYKNLAKEYHNVEFYDTTRNLEAILKADVMLCDSSSIINEFLLLDKPVVTYRNTNPGKHLLNVRNIEDVEKNLEIALKCDDELLKNIRAYSDENQKFRDGKCSDRVLDAVNDFIENYKGRIKSKPLNLFRKIKLRYKIHYPLFKDLF